jgi:hypothetical protein
MGGEKCESGERIEVQARWTVASTVSKARSRSREVVNMDEEPRIFAESVNEIIKYHKKEVEFRINLLTVGNHISLLYLHAHVP